jgi:predicted Rossmann-fold nucleotide-binding protein
VLLNVNEYYGPILEQLDRGIEQRFIKARVRELFFVADDVASAIEHIRTYEPAPVSDKWFGLHVPSGSE